MCRRRFVVFVGLVGTITLPPAGVAGQTDTASPSTADSGTWSLTHTPDGQPDLQGVWSFATITPLERPGDVGGREFFTDEEVAARDRDAQTRNDESPETGNTGTYNSFWWDRGNTLTNRRTSLIVDPPDGRLPALTHAAKAREEAMSVRGFDSWESRSLWERCVLGGGVPRLSTGYNNNLQILQTSEYVVILYEMIHEARIIPLTGQPHLSGTIHQYLGDSRGRWEGDTLIVETDNFTDRTHLAYRGVHHGDALHLVERFTRTDAGTLRYEFTVDDPTTWARSWTATLPMTKSGEQVYEYACHEGNYGMTNLLSGARAEEKATADGLKTNSR